MEHMSDMHFKMSWRHLNKDGTFVPGTASSEDVTSTYPTTPHTSRGAAHLDNCMALQYVEYVAAVERSCGFPTRRVLYFRYILPIERGGQHIPTTLTVRRVTQ